MNEFQYLRALSEKQALQQVGSVENARFLAGGTNLIDLMKYGVESAGAVVDLSHLRLSEIEALPHGGLRIGAMVRNSDMAADHRVAGKYPALSQAILSGASPQLRNLATTGGNLLQRTRCYYFYDTAFPCNKRAPGSGCPAVDGVNRIHAILGQSLSCIAVHPSDMAVAMAALDAKVQVVSAEGARTIPILEFHRLPGDSPERDTNLAKGELIRSVDLPWGPVYENSAYLKVRDRNSYAFALVSAAVGLHVENGVIREARVALGGVAHKPWRKMEAEAILVGKPASAESFRLCADAVLEGASGYRHNQFKIELARRTIVRAFSSLRGVSV